jgi:hypothetical protein
MHFAAAAYLWFEYAKQSARTFSRCAYTYGTAPAERDFFVKVYTQRAKAPRRTPRALKMIIIYARNAESLPGTANAELKLGVSRAAPQCNLFDRLK